MVDAGNAWAAEGDDTGDEHVGPHHNDVSGGWLRPAVFGAMDGLVTNIALVAGVGGAGADSRVIVLTGMAGLVAGAFSMALGEYASVDTQNNAVQAEVATEREELRRHPRAELAELIGMYQDMGLSEGTAATVAAEVHSNPDLAVRVHITQELGVDPDEQPSPWTAAILSFLCFAVGAVLPLLPYLFGSHSLALGLGVGAVGLFIGGRDGVPVHHPDLVVQRPAPARVRGARRCGDLPGRLADRGQRGLTSPVGTGGPPSTGVASTGWRRRGGVDRGRVERGGGVRVGRPNRDGRCARRQRLRRSPPEQQRSRRHQAGDPERRLVADELRDGAGQHRTDDRAEIGRHLEPGEHRSSSTPVADHVGHRGAHRRVDQPATDAGDQRRDQEQSPARR